MTLACWDFWGARQVSRSPGEQDWDTNQAQNSIDRCQVPAARGFFHRKKRHLSHTVPEHKSSFGNSLSELALEFYCGLKIGESSNYRLPKIVAGSQLYMSRCGENRVPLVHPVVPPVGTLCGDHAWCEEEGPVRCREQKETLCMHVQNICSPMMPYYFQIVRMSLKYLLLRSWEEC